MSRLPQTRDLGLDVAAPIQWLCGRGTPIELQRGQTYHPEGPVLIARGELAVELAGRHAQIRSQGSILCLEQVDEFSDVRLRALTETTLVALDEERLNTPEAAPVLLNAARAELAWARRREHRWLRGTDEVMSSPGAQLIPGPYTFAPMPIVQLVFEREAETLERLLPPGVRPIPGLRDRYLVLVSEVERCGTAHPRGAGRSFRYREVTIFLPCLGPRGRPALYAPELYPDAVAPILLGREIYGFPKRLAQIDIGPRGLSFACDGRLRMHARWHASRAMSPADYGRELASALTGDRRPRLSGAVGRTYEILEGLGLGGKLLSTDVLVRKRIPEPHAQSKWRIDELVRIPFQTTGLRCPHQLEKVEVSLEADEVLGGTCVGGFAARMGFRFGEGRACIDYTRPLPRWRRWWARDV